MATINADNVTRSVAKLGRKTTPEQADLLARYLGMLEQWNRRMNLVGPSRWEDMLDSLVVDSLYLAEFLNDRTLRADPLCLDLGAGAGLPGIPLRMFWQSGRYWLVEVRQKRVGFMRSALARLDLPRTEVFHGRAEDALERLQQSGQESTADLIVSKAFMPWDKLLDFTRPMLRPATGDQAGGQLVILSNDPPPENDLPDTWNLMAAASYPVQKKQHYFWALSPC
ncbi:16S rRNA (guanine(527)-N(7))-methyltransferase RsmG [Pseudodesulfovibrio senegalensis]|uniref:Ribosomal RNA small subunit methyltransferase G n=1 Tax=Pseudodesulfovibrio senegalensis TaxID=1721087 RepID=A0A6N6MYW7_9BACT|nr:16S rRNA (guanine(527)-N(7))-methyltransferase RsmG [Pseudodesulfovibrio senegalensis]KAB1437253.1 16S rRNA (guanine(527)-N(7))-methyltransferase RsmG [Pseudodesulfovibrio senegalensis]